MKNNSELAEKEKAELSSVHNQDVVIERQDTMVFGVDVGVPGYHAGFFVKKEAHTQASRTSPKPQELKPESESPSCAK
jgi:hypothetical protein